MVDPAFGYDQAIDDVLDIILDLLQEWDHIEPAKQALEDLKQEVEGLQGLVCE